MTDAPRTAFHVVATGGTFDHLHKGHKALLARAFTVGETVLIGVTSDQLAAKLRPGAKIDHRYSARARQLKAYLTQHYPGRKFLVRKLEDYFGPSIYTKAVEAMVVSKETRRRVQLANRKRRQLGLPPLKTIIVNYVLAEDGKPISSTRIRRGEINADGQLLTRE